MMNSTNSLTASSGKDSLNISVPHPLVLRHDNAMYYEQPYPPTPGFTSPPRTPQGSPSKHKPPPGAHDLPGVFQNALRIAPPEFELSNAVVEHSPTSPLKREAHHTNRTSEAHGPELSTGEMFAASGSPLKPSNKENTFPFARPALLKDSSFITHAAASRREPYKPREQSELHQKSTLNRGFTKEELEKLQKPSVKRLANVTQLCRSELLRGDDILTRVTRFP